MFYAGYTECLGSDDLCDSVGGVLEREQLPWNSKACGPVLILFPLLLLSTKP